MIADEKRITQVVYIYISKPPGHYIVYKICKTIYKTLKFNGMSLQREIPNINDLPTRYSASPNPTISALHLTSATRHNLNNLEYYHHYNDNDEQNLTIPRYTYHSHKPILPLNHVTKPDQQPTTPGKAQQRKTLLSTTRWNAPYDSPAILLITQPHHGASASGRPHTSRNSLPLRK